MLERYLVEHCSPTLAGLKTANLGRGSAGADCSMECVDE